MTSSYDILINKLDDFIRKYYKNQIIKGLILSLSLLLGVYLFVVVLEYFGEFSREVRTILFYSYVCVSLYLLFKYIFIPAAKLYRIGNRISNEEAAKLIGKHFSNVSDKLLNILQLNHERLSNPNELLLASIDQKSEEIKPVPFSSAINFFENKQYLIYLVPVLFSIVVLSVFYPKMLSQSTNRLLNHQTHFEKTMPFQFLINNPVLQAYQGDDFELIVDVAGEELPKELYVVLGGNKFRMQKKKSNQFGFLFKNLKESFSFQFFTLGFFTKDYFLEVIKKPSILSVEATIVYPSYTNKKQELKSNFSDLFVPFGTEIKWILTAQNTETLTVFFPDSVFSVKQQDEDVFIISKIITQSASYGFASNNNKNAAISYFIQAIPDQYPTIQVSQIVDTLSGKRFYFSGIAGDDYGLTNLYFYYSISNEGAEKTSKKEKLIVNTSFSHYLDLTNIELSAGDQVDYYFEVWDNDGFNGSKSTKSTVFSYKTPTLSELEANAEKNKEEIKENLQNSLLESKEIQKELEVLKRKLTEKKELNWEDKNKLKELLEKQKNLEKNIEDIKQKNLQNNFEQSEYREIDERILEKQKQLEKLFEEVLTEEMKKMFEELEKLLDETDKKKMQEMLENMKLTNEDIEKELDRTLELFKQLEVEQKLEETIEKLQQLAKKQDELAEKTKDTKQDKEQLKNEQNALNKEFEKLQKDLDELKEKNEALENPMSLEDTKKQEEEIKKDIQESEEQLENNKNKKSSESKKKAAEKMQDLAQQLEKAQQQNQEQKNEEDIDALRQILQNLIALSFSQEELMLTLKKLNTNDPQYVVIGQKQKKLEADAKMIEDTLFALSKRNPQIHATVNREINAINQNMEAALFHIQERQTPQASGKQQYIMTSVNNLALLLDEIVQQMQQQQSQKKFGSSSCSKPGSNSMPKPSNMKKVQEQINKQIQELKEQQKGQKPGEKPGGKSGGENSMQIAKLAAEQQALRNEIQKLAKEMGDQGNKSGQGKLDKLAELMEETEKDLVNKNITRETLQRQQEILNKLLEHENAELERELDEKRKSNEAKNQENSNPEQFFEYNKLKQREAELLKTVPVVLSDYYKQKVNTYFNTIQND
jgi:hypothetical protein